MYNKILVPLDGSEMAECVLPHVEAIASGCGVKSVTLIRVMEPVYTAVVSDAEYYTFSPQDWTRMEGEARTAAENYLKKVVAKTEIPGASLEYVVMEGRTGAAIARYADENGFDLIAIATHGRSGVSRWLLGSVADRVMRTSNVPVLMVRSPECRVENE